MQPDVFPAAIFFTLINCIGAILFFALILGFIALMRYFSYRETVALVEKGLVRDDSQSKSSLRWGIVILAIGLALCIGLYPLGFNPGNTAEYVPFRLGPWMVIGFVPTFIGIALIAVHYITRDKPKNPSDKKDQ
ncbi:MAG: hypothetical protein HZB51_31730 [Chloroflexi bacterium]|nr:hypothetical protein [Chloroflexota bacterium]